MKIKNAEERDVLTRMIIMIFQDLKNTKEERLVCPEIVSMRF